MKKNYFIFVASIFLFVLFFYWKKIFDLLSPVFLALVLTYIAWPFVNFVSKRIPKILGAIIFYLIIFGIITLLVSFILPSALSGIKSLLDYIPKISEKFPLISYENIASFLRNKENSISSLLKDAFSFVSDFFIAVLLSCFFLMDFEGLKKGFTSIIPSVWIDNLTPTVREIDCIFKSFIRGQLLISLILSLITFAFLLVLKIEYSLVLSLLYGLFCIIPTIGPFIGAIPVIALSALQSPKAILYSVATIIITQIIDNTIISHKIKGNSVDISPAAALISVYIGAGLFGFFGIILAIPFFASLKIILRRVLSVIS